MSIPPMEEYGFRDDQDVAARLVDAFRALDEQGLARLSEQERQEQRDARRVLFAYVDRLWADFRAPYDENDEGLPETPERFVLAGMRDLTLALMVNPRRAL